MKTQTIVLVGALAAASQAPSAAQASQDATKVAPLNTAREITTQRASPAVQKLIEQKAATPRKGENLFVEEHGPTWVEFIEHKRDRSKKQELINPVDRNVQRAYKRNNGQ